MISGNVYFFHPPIDLAKHPLKTPEAETMASCSWHCWCLMCFFWVRNKQHKFVVKLELGDFNAVFLRKNSSTLWSDKNNGAAGSGTFLLSWKVMGSNTKWPVGKISHSSRWWFQIFSNFTPTWGRFPFLTNIFQGGWNHQLQLQFYSFECILEK